MDRPTRRPRSPRPRLERRRARERRQKNGISGFIAADGGFVPVKVQVTAGYHTLHVYMREDGVAIDKIVMSMDSAAPTGTGPVESPRE
jgi:hypothetical protein